MWVDGALKAAIRTHASHFESYQTLQREVGSMMAQDVVPEEETND